MSKLLFDGREYDEPDDLYLAGFAAGRAACEHVESCDGCPWLNAESNRCDRRADGCSSRAGRGPNDVAVVKSVKIARDTYRSSVYSTTLSCGHVVTLLPEEMSFCPVCGREIYFEHPKAKWN